MELLRDFEGIRARLTAERLEHILEHPEMRGLVGAIATTLARPERVVRSASDASARLYYRFQPGTPVGDKCLRVVVKRREGDAFVLTAYLTDRVKRGKLLWPRED